MSVLPALVPLAVTPPTLGGVFVSEVLGTAILLLLGCGVVANAILPKVKGGNANFLMIGWGWGIGVFAGVYVAFASGAHLNPAVTVGILVSGASEYAPGVPITLASTLVYFAGEMLGAFPCELLLADEETARGIARQLDRLPQALRPKRIEVVPESFDWGRVSSQRQPQPLLGVFTLPQEDEGSPIASGVSLLLDRIQDPGNLGTIIRTADWFGIEHLYLAPGTADPFAPKVVQATMGALTRVKVHRLSDTVAFLKDFSGPRLGTFLGGEDLYTTELPTGKDEPVLLIMGNEGQGIHPDLEPHIDRRITIPPYPAENSHTESLNVAIATALLLGELRRRL